MNKEGFPPDSWKDSSKSKHFRFSDVSTEIDNELKINKDTLMRFRFWINLSDLKYNDSFNAYFELFGSENTIYGDKLKQRLEELGIFNDKVMAGTGGKSGSGYQHIFHISIPIKILVQLGIKRSYQTS